MAVGHSAASVRPHGRRWIATSTTSCARASASPVTVSPCFGPCHALVPANCTRPTPRLSQLVNEMAPTLALPPRGRCGRDRHTAAAVVPQRHLRGRVRGRAGRQGHQGLGCAEGERGGGRRRGVKRGVKRGGRRVTGSLLARRGRSGSAQFITWPRLVTPWRGRGHSPLVRATPLASRHCFQMSGRMFPHFPDTVFTSARCFLCCRQERALSDHHLLATVLHPTTVRATLRVGYGSQPREHPQSRQP